MARNSLFTQMFSTFMVVILAGLAASTWEASRSMRTFHLGQTENTLEARAKIVVLEMAGMFSEINAAKLDAICKQAGRFSGTRLTVILPTGKVIADSDESPGRMDNHSDRPEVREALAGRTGRAIRYSHTLGTDYVYVAIPVFEKGAAVGVLRASTSLASVNNALRGVYMRMILSGGGVALLSVLLSLFLARRIAKPVKRMVAGTRRLSSGDFETRLALPASAELAELAMALNTMSDELRQRMETEARQRGELEAVLSSMGEGTLAVDREERVIGLNRAAAALFGVDAENSRGRDLREVVRNPKLQSCAARVLETGEPFQVDVTLYTPEERHLLVSATSLRQDTETAHGALLVLEDVTELRRLERIRSDFVANVSHEIRTPVTSIKGYAETLLNEARHDPETLDRFLEIIARQSDRLSSLVDDILSLARLERSETSGETEFEPVDVRTIIEAALHVCEPKANERGIHLETSTPEDTVIRANPALAEQALVNILDNAVKYTDPGGRVHIDVTSDERWTFIHVTDSGPGIAPDHLSRIFERFYRVDRGRSRAMGGTGLGLAIVKHIMTVHGGRVDVESELGKGSRFSLMFPISHQE